MEAARPTVVAVKRVLGGDVMQVLLPKPSVALLRERVAAATKASKADVMLFNYGRELVDDDDAAAMALPDARIPLALVVRTDSTGPTSLGAFAARAGSRAGCRAHPRAPRLRSLLRLLLTLPFLLRSRCSVPVGCIQARARRQL